MKAYKIILLIIILTQIGHAAVYCYDAYRDKTPWGCSDCGGYQSCCAEYYDTLYGINYACYWDGSTCFLSTGTPCSTTTSSTISTTPTTTLLNPYAIPNENYGTLPGLNGTGGTLPGTGISNTSGMGSTILGLQKTNFFMYVAIAISLCLLMVKPYIIGATLSVISVLFFSLILPWNSITTNVALIVVALAVYGWYLKVRT